MESLHYSSSELSLLYGCLKNSIHKDPDTEADIFERVQELLVSLSREGYPAATQLCITHVAYFLILARESGSPSHLTEGVKLAKDFLDRSSLRLIAHVAGGAS
jgi:hypothetical protein